MTDAPTNNMAEATREAVRLTRERLAGVDLAQAAARGGLTLDESGAVQIAFLGRKLRVLPGSLAVVAEDGAPISLGDEGLVLRYLEAGREVKPTGQEITFRNLPGGNFYFGPVDNRTSKLVLKVFGNDLERLKAALGRYPYEAVGIGDLGVKVHALGRLDVTLIYRQGDEEFPPDSRHSLRSMHRRRPAHRRSRRPGHPPLRRADQGRGEEIKISHKSE